METQARSSKADPVPAESSVPTYPPPGRRGPTTAAGAAFLEELRARRQLDHLYGTHTINPEETLQERDERIKRTLEGLRTLEEYATSLGAEELTLLDEVFDATASSRFTLPDRLGGDSD
jgi:hypothetical protein